MGKRLQILLVEDSHRDEILLRADLEQGGFEPVVTRVTTAETLQTHLDSGSWDLVVAGYMLENFDGLTALELVKSSGKDIPFIMMSGRVGEEMAVEAMLRGAQDFITKQARHRLLPAIRRELEAAALRRERLRAEHEFRTIFREMLDGFAVHEMLWDEEGRAKDYRFLVVNPAFERFTGLKNADITGKTVLEVLPDTECHWIETYERVVLTGEPVSFNSYAAALDRHFHVRAFRSGPNQFACTFVDITANVQTEESLRMSERRFRTLAEASPLALYETGASGDCLYVNKRWSDLSGLSLEEAKGKGWLRALHPDDREWVATLWYEHVLDAEPWDLEYRFLTPGGVESHLWGSAVALRDANGNITGYMGANVDISERKRAEEELRASEEHFRALVENTPDIVMRFDRACRHCYVSPSVKEIMHIPSSDFLGKTHREMGFPEQKCVYWENKILQVFEKGDPLKEDFELETHSGKKRFEWRLFPEYNAKGKVETVLSISRDITREYGLERQLRQSQKMEAIGTLAGGIAHDFNNILQVILGHAELARCETPANSLPASCLQEIVTAGQRATELVKQILAFSRQAEQHRAPIKAQRIVKEAMKLLQGVLPSTIEVRSNIDPRCGAVLADPTRIHQIVMNLCTNACHAMRETGGRLDVNLERTEVSEEFTAEHPELSAGGYVVLTVADTGCGMDDTVMKCIFDPYFTTKNGDEGTGLGLSVVHGIVKEMNGAILVDSTPGAGSRFRVFLPLLPDTVSPHTPKRPVVNPSFEGTERVLLVDDELGIVRILEHTLLQCGYQVEALTSSLVAREHIFSTPDRYDVLITDQTMPHLTGAQLAQELLRLRPNFPVVLCTGYSEFLDKFSASETETRKCILKPFLPETLLEALRSVLDASKKNVSKEQ